VARRRQRPPNRRAEAEQQLTWARYIARAAGLHPEDPLRPGAFGVGELYMTLSAEELRKIAERSTSPAAKQVLKHLDLAQAV
jgi:hypothetical protein